MTALVNEWARQTICPELSSSAVSELRTPKWRRSLTDKATLTKVAFGTEGGLFQSRLGIPTIICGPGSMDQGHKPDEFIERSQLDACDAMMDRLIEKLAADKLA